MSFDDDHPPASAWQVFLIFLRLGCISFGGPVAHLALFRDEFVRRRGWLGERDYVELVALCQFLPGPASSQVGMALGMSRRGYGGALAAWAGFTLPPAVLLICLALGVAAAGQALPDGLVHGLKLVTVAVVAQAVWAMARSLCRGWQRLALMAGSALVLLLWPFPLSQLLVMAAAGLIGWRWLQSPGVTSGDSLAIGPGREAGRCFLGLFFLLLAALPLAARLWPQPELAAFDAFYRTGSLVFGGGHVMLPLLQAEVVGRGWLDRDIFLSGYGVVQALPGPLFAFSAYVGTALQNDAGGWSGGLLCLVAIFLPAFLLLAGALPLWSRLRTNPSAQAALAGVNAAVVGLLLAALYRPVWTSAVFGVGDFLFVLLALAALLSGRLPAWAVVVVGGVGYWLVQG
ncbi:Chromate transport protein [compost metagenome]